MTIRYDLGGENLNESILMQTADKMVASGLVDAGYSYLNIDDGAMSSERLSNGSLQVVASRHLRRKC